MIFPHTKLQCQAWSRYYRKLQGRLVSDLWLLLDRVMNVNAEEAQPVSTVNASTCL